MRSHFEFEEWADFVRRTVEPARHRAMSTHLEEGCADCSEIVRVQWAVLAAARREADYIPPTGLAERARAIFTPAEPSPLADLPLLLARWVRDTTAGPLPVGLRSVAARNTHVLLEAAGVSVDVRLEPGDRKRGDVLTGQVLEVNQPGTHHGAILPAVLLRGGAVVAQAVINELGEFRFEGMSLKGTCLQVPASGGTQRVEIALDDVASGRGGEHA